MRLRTKIVVIYWVIFLFLMGSVMVAASLLIGNSFDKMHLQDVQTLQYVIDADYRSLGKKAGDEVANIVRANSAEIVRALGTDQDPRDLWRQMERGTGLDILELGNGNGTIMASVHDPVRFGITDKEALKLAKSRIKDPILRMRSGSRLTVECIRAVPAKGQVLAFVVGGYYLKDRLRPVGAGADFIFLLQGNVPNLISGTGVSMDDLKGELEKIAKPVSDVKPSPAVSKVNLPQDQKRKLSEGSPEPKRQHIDLPKIHIGDKEYTVGVIPLMSHKNTQLGAIIAAFSNTRSKSIQLSLIRSLIGVAIAGILAAYIAGFFIARSVTKPVQDLVNGAEIISGGDLDHKIETNAHGEVKFLVDSFNQMTVSLKENREKLLSAERIAAWQDVARTIAHEIKNPLFPIQLSIRSMRRAYQSDKDNFNSIFDGCTQTIVEEVESLRKIVDEFGQFARMPKPQLTECDLNQVIKDTLALYTGKPEGVEIVAELADNIPHIMGDGEQLSRAFLNIISNAIQAMPDGGKLTISTSLNEVPGKTRTIQAIFTDTGIGMSPEVQEKVFQPYFTTKEGGTGLGMAIVQRIITDHKGTIEVESKEHAGTKITIKWANGLIGL